MRWTALSWLRRRLFRQAIRDSRGQPRQLRPEVEALESRWLLTAGITEYAVPTSVSQPLHLTVGPDGNLWFTENFSSKIGMITTAGSISEYSLPSPANFSFPQDITSGPDGNLWVTVPGSSADYLVKCTTAGNMTVYSLPSGFSAPHGLTATTGSDGNLWLVENIANKVARATTAGSFTEYTIPTSNSFPQDIVAGPDGNLWFTEHDGNKIGKVTTSGSFTEYSIPTSSSSPEDITVGPDGNLWFTESGGNKIGRLTPLGSLSEFSIPTGSSGPAGITAGADGNLWFVEYGGNQIGRITPSGTITEYGGLALGAGPSDIVAGPDGNLWLTETSANNLAKYGGELGATLPSTEASRSVYVPFGPAAVSPQTGDVLVTNALDFRRSVPDAALDASAGLGGDPALVYNSDSVTVKPIIQATFASDAQLAVPTQIQAQLTWNNGTPQSWVTFSTSGHSAGDVYLLDLQVASAVTSTGLYPWKVEVQVTQSGDTLDRTIADTAVVVVNGSSDPFGQGWSLAGLDRLVIDSAGVGWAEGGGGSRYFAATGGGTFLSPPNDRGTLVQNGDSTYTYTAKDQVKWYFDSSGNLTRVVDPHGLAVTYSYSSGKLSGVAEPDGGLATFSYSSGQVTVAEPGGRTVTLTLDGNNNLTGLANPDGSLRTFTYDSGHRLTNQQWGPLSATYTYDSGNGELTGIDQGGGNTLNLTPVNVQGLATSPAVNSSRALGVLTDARSHVTTYTLDRLGDLLKLQTPDGVSQSWQVDFAGQAVTTTDALGRTTTYSYLYGASAGDLSNVFFPDGSSAGFGYDATFHKLTGVVDQRGQATDFSYDGTTGDLLTVTNALNQVTTQTWSGGLLQTVTDARSHTTSYVWDTATRQLDAVVDANGGRTTFGYDAAGNPATVQDANSHVTSLSYDGMRRVLTVTDAAAGVTSFSYNALGEVTAQTDALGHTTSYGYDSHGWQTTVTEAVGTAVQRTTTYLYDAAGNVTQVTDPDGHATQFLYDAMNRQTVTIDALGGRTTALLDAVGNVTQVTDANGHATQFLYDALNRQTVTIDALSHRATALLDAAGNVTQVTDANNHSTQFLYDALNRQTVTIDALGGRTTSLLDAVGNVTQVTDANSHATQFLYDALNRQTVTIDAQSHRTTALLDAVGNVTGLRDVNNHLTQFLYDALNRRTVTIDALNGRTTALFDAVDNVTQVTDANNHSRQFLYDALNRLTVSVDGLGNRTTALLDAVGNVTQVTDANGHATQFLYDALNRQTVTIDAVGNRSTVLFDAVGNVTQVSDGNNHATQFLYDALNRQTVTIDTRNYRTTVLLDAVGNVTQVTDADSNATQFSYDALNRKTQETDPLGKSATFAYDAVGNLTSTTDRLGRVDNFAYDSLDRLTTATWVNGGTTVNTMTYGYDANGNLLAAANNYGAYTMTYDALDRTTTVLEPCSQHLTFSYDAVGNRTLVLDSQGGVTTSVYDAANNLTSRQFGGTGQTPLRVDFTYNGVNEAATATRYSNLAGTVTVGSTSFTYDSDERLSNLKHWNAAGTSTLANYTYTYDTASNLQTETLNGTTTTYSYDAANQLTSDGTNSFSDDATGNRTNTGYTTGTGNRLTNDGTWTYSYDDEGNLTKKTKGASAETWTYGYDNDNQLLWAEDRSTDGGALIQRVDYKYDVFGNRIELDYTPAVGPTATYLFAYDGWKTHLDAQGNPPTFVGTENWDVWADLNGSNALQTRYVRGNAVDQILARVSAAGTAVWYLTDRLGSVRDLTDNNGAVQDHLNYDGFGNVVSESTPSFSDRYKYVGREFDSVTGLYDERARYYAPGTGSWTTADPLGFAAGDPNLYRYVGNDPTDMMDPSGLAPVTLKFDPKNDLNKIGLEGGLFIVSTYTFPDPVRVVVVARDNGSVVPLGPFASSITALTQQINTASKGGQTFKMITIWGHCGGGDGIFRPGVLLQNPKDGKVPPGGSFDLANLTPGLIAAIQKALQPGGVLVIASCGHQADYDAKVGKEGAWAKQLQALADKLGVIVAANTGYVGFPQPVTKITSDGDIIKVHLNKWGYTKPKAKPDPKQQWMIKYPKGVKPVLIRS
jgi:RHS repeat-associated protein